MAEHAIGLHPRRRDGIGSTIDALGRKELPILSDFRRRSPRSSTFFRVPLERLPDLEVPSLWCARQSVDYCFHLALSCAFLILRFSLLEVHIMKYLSSGVALGVALAMASLTFNTAAAQEPIPPLVQEMATTLGFTPSEIAKLVEGEIVSTTLDEGSEKEIALAVAMVVQTNHQTIYKRIKNGEWFSIDRTVSASQELAGEITPDSFSTLTLPAAEIRRLTASGLHRHFNLSGNEVEELETIAAEPAARLDAYRRLLAKRASSYKRKGIAAIAPYSRGRKKNANPAEDLRTAAGALAGMSMRCGEFYEAFAYYPESPTESASHRFFWATQTIQDRPTVVLSHWTTQLHTGYGLIAERQFYVGQSYNAQQIVAGAFALSDSESIVFYTNRTASDQVAGFGSTAAHAIGRRFMLSEVVALFESMRTSFDSSSKI